jgi:hypothetical protein
MQSPAAIAALAHHHLFARRSFCLTPTRSDCQTAPTVCGRTAVPPSLSAVWRRDGFWSWRSHLPFAGRSGWFISADPVVEAAPPRP